MGKKSDKGRQRLKMSDSDRQRLTKSDTVSQSLPNEKPSPAHTLTVPEVYEMFKAAGVIRSQRSISRWCEKNAEGQSRFDAVIYREAGGQEKYYITPESAKEILAEERAKDAHLGLLAGLSGGDTFSQTRSDPESRTSWQPSGAPAHDPALEEYLKEMQDKYGTRDLVILNRFKDIYIQKSEQRDEFNQKKIENLNYRIGSLERQLQLEPPKEVLMPAVEIIDNSERQGKKSDLSQPEDKIEEASETGDSNQEKKSTNNHDGRDDEATESF